MMDKLKPALKHAVLAAVGGSVYVLLELVLRGRSHWTMFLLGGLCFVLIGLLNEVIPWEMPLLLQGVIGSAIVSALECITGCIVNLWLGWDVWDYSDMWGNILGQICPAFIALWMPISLLSIVVDDMIRWIFFNEEKPRYKL